MKLSNLQLHELKPLTENAIEVTLRLKRTMIGNNETNFSHKFTIN